MTSRDPKPPHRQFRFDRSFTQGGIKYLIWYAKEPAPGDLIHEEIVYNADYFWGLR